MALASEKCLMSTDVRLFTDAQLEEIHLASLEILDRTGVRVYDYEAVRLLQDAGCLIADKDLVKIPAAVIERALQHVPNQVVLYNRNGETCVYLEGNRTYFGTGSDLPYILDLETGERRPSLLLDVRQTSRLVDALPNLDFVMSMALPTDVPAKISDRLSFLSMVENTTKPIVFTAWDEIGLADIIAMSEVIAGGSESLSTRPFLLAYLEPVSPLQHSKEAVKKILMMADHGLPFVYAPGAMSGITAPMTPAGSLALVNAEVLSGMLIAQLRREGTPIIWGAGCGPMDMRTMIAPYASPEGILHCIAMAELARHYYRVPVWGYAGCCDSKVLDAQAGIEASLGIFCAALSGANLVHDVGYMESGLTGSYELIVLCDEIISLVRRMLQGIGLGVDQFALDIINQVGPGGNFLHSPHTREHHRKSWSPRILDWQSYQAWRRAGHPSVDKTARDVAREILATHTPLPLDAEILRELTTIVELAEAGIRNSP